MRDVLAEGTEVGQTRTSIRSAELLEHLTGLSADFLRRNCFDKFPNGASRQSIVANNEEMEDGGSEARAEGDDGNGFRRAAQVVEVVPVNEDFIRRDDHVSNEPL